ncbi:MAG: hypothetical protein HRT67_03180 [Flavobacteriaceae bacterium]|nr:hypothetical protein [Flavobacteriaceae bacterium]
MKKIILCFYLCTIFSACKNDTNKTNDLSNTTEHNTNVLSKDDDLTLLKGEFVFYNNAAVLQTSKEFYGIIINEKTHELNTMVQAYKTDDTDMVPVEIKGRVTDKKDPIIKWKYKVEIVEILNVSKPKADTNQTIKLGTK